MRTSTLNLSGVATPVREAGPESASEAVVFVHGNPGSGRDWEQLLERVGEHGRAVAPDMPGFGRAAKPDEFSYTVDGYARHLQAVVQELGITRAHLVLHDFGGPWGLVWALQHQPAVGSLTLINTGVLIDYRWHVMARMWRRPVIGELLQATTTRRAFHWLLRRGQERRPLPPAFLDAMYDDYDRGTRRAVLRLYRATRDRVGPEIAAAFSGLKVPVLVLWGARDPYIGVEQAQRQREVFPQAEVVTLPDSGHWPFQDDPEATERIVVPFLAERLAGIPAPG